MTPFNQTPERDHQDSIKKCVIVLDPEFVRECLPDETARQDAIKLRCWDEGRLEEPMSENDYNGEKCTCKEDCPKVCKGGCGCTACRTAYSDFLSGE